MVRLPKKVRHLKVRLRSRSPYTNPQSDRIGYEKRRRFAPAKNYIVEPEGLEPFAPNAVISIRYRLINYLCNEYVTNNFHHSQRLSCRHPNRQVSYC